MAKRRPHKKATNSSGIPVKGKISANQINRLFQQAEKHHQAGNLLEAERGYRSILDIIPRHTASLVQLANMAMHMGRLSIALEYAKRAVESDHALPQTHQVLANVLASLGLADLAESEFTIALQLDNSNSDTLNSLGNVYVQQGRIDEAIDAFHKAITLDPDNVLPYYNLSTSKRFTPGDPDSDLIKGLLNTLSLKQQEDQAIIHFALGKVYHDCGDYEAAFKEYHQGNDLKSAQAEFNVKTYGEDVERIIRTLDESWSQQLAGSGVDSQGAIFIVGMPRSGTTLLESLLCSHPQISGIGEPPYIQNLANFCGQRVGNNLVFPEAVTELTDDDDRELGKTYVSLSRQFGVNTSHVIDKTPVNFLYLGFIFNILPNAKVIHSIRNPVDTCLSIYQQYFSHGMTYAYNLANIGYYYLGYQRIMDHWKSLFPERILEVNYEDVVVDKEKQLRRIFEFCELPWDGRCLDESEVQYVSRTASTWQARQPVYQSSVQRWRHYESYLGPLLEVLKPVLE